MPSHEPAAAGTDAPVALALSDLFEGVGTGSLTYGAACRTLNGRALTVAARLTRSHDCGQWLAVNEAGVCPDCSPTPVAVLQLEGLALPDDFSSPELLQVQGRLSYGFAIDGQGNASFLRLEGAQLLNPPAAS